MREHDQPVAQESLDDGHEPNNFRVKIAVIVCVGVFVLSAFAFGVTYFLYQGLTEEADANGRPTIEVKRARQQQIRPKLRHGGNSELKEMRAASNRVLDSYREVDVEKGVYRVPIDRAMELLLQDPLPARGDTPEPPNSSVDPGNDEKGLIDE